MNFDRYQLPKFEFSVWMSNFDWLMMNKRHFCSWEKRVLQWRSILDPFWTSRGRPIWTNIGRSMKVHFGPLLDVSWTSNLDQYRTSFGRRGQDVLATSVLGRGWTDLTWTSYGRQNRTSYGRPIWTSDGRWYFSTDVVWTSRGRPISTSFWRPG